MSDQWNDRVRRVKHYVRSNLATKLMYLRGSSNT